MAVGKQLIIERILRDRAGIWDQIIGERDLPKLILRMLLASAISLAAYGAVLGASSGWLQALVSTVKLPLLFLVTLAICLPTLYLFNLVFGARLSVLQACALIMVAITVTAVLTFAFAPISLFFLITARSYAFFKLLNVTILAPDCPHRAAVPYLRDARAQRAHGRRVDAFHPDRRAGGRVAAGAGFGDGRRRGRSRGPAAHQRRRAKPEPKSRVGIRRRGRQGGCPV